MTDKELESVAWAEALARQGWSTPLIAGMARAAGSGAEQCGKGKCIRDEGHDGECFGARAAALR